MSDLDEFHWHEVVDRAYVAMELLATSLEEHPVIESDKELNDLLGAAHEAIYNLYQRAAQKRMDRYPSSDGSEHA